MIVNEREFLLTEEAGTSLAGAVGPTVTGISKERPTEHELSGYKVEGMFRTIGDNLKKKEYATATFDARDGHPTHYVFRKQRSSERLEWDIRLTRPESQR